MTSFQNSTDFRHDQAGCLGVLITNLGTPDAPTPKALRRYLAQFLWDPRVVETPRPLWWLILHGVILRFRPARAARAYQTVWSEAGSPLLQFSRQQEAALRASLQHALPGPVQVALGMRYGNPSIEQGLEELRQAGARRILVLPLYPQYSATTSASTLDAVSDVLRRWRWVPDLRFVSHYPDDPGYIQALANSIREHRASHGDADRLLFSFHGIPKRYLLNGDPYHCECHKTARLVAEALGLEADRHQLVFQSRFGREEWLQPYCDKTLEALPGQGVKSVQVVCPGFSADCLETLEEIAEQNRELFLQAGGERFEYIPALNAREDHIQALTRLILQHAQGWPEAAADWDAARLARESQETLARARALGAER